MKIALAAACLLACLSPSLASATAATNLNELVEAYYEDMLELNPIMATFNGDHRFNDRLANSIGPEHIQASLALEVEYLEGLHAIDRSKLEGQDLLSYEIFERDREESIASADIPQHLLPINQMFSMPVLFPRLGVVGGMQPFKSVADYDNFLGRIDGFAAWMDQAIVNMREGAATGVVHPRIIMERVLPVLASQIVDKAEDSMFYGVVEAMPDEFSDEDTQRLSEAYRVAIMEKLVRAYASVHDYVRDEYLEQCRDSAGISAIPGGDRWYEFAIASFTSTHMTADEIHELGQREVSRILAEMETLAQQVGFEGGVAEVFAYIREQPEMQFSSEEDMLEAYRGLKDSVWAATPKLFHELPEADFEIRAVEEYRQATTPGAHYMSPSPDGSRPGIFYVNTGGWENRTRAGTESLYIHEAVPGHHFQIAIARELEELPRFRRFGGNTAYSEGWGLYAESLGKDLGLYENPYMHLGMLGSELFRARRLVVDTGLHAKGWTRDQAIEYMQGNSNEVDRYMVMPGQALAYKIGQLKISELRARAEKAFGDDFDIRDFHAEILKDGPLPIDVLGKKVDRWISAASSGM